MIPRPVDPMRVLVPVLICALCARPSPAQDLAAAHAAERQRVDVMRRVAPAVCSVMPLDAPGGGSGVVFDPAGFVLTNFHVVGKEEVEQMKIGTPDGELHKATVLGIDPGSDLAVLLLPARADGSPWPSAPLGDSDQLLEGEEVFAMGNPFLLASDFVPTTTFGIVSGTHRYQPGQGNRAGVYPDCIQVDVPINPGNSGGPLFNLRGEVVGINGRISIQDQRGRVNVGVGFAIASNQIRNFLPDLMAGRFAEHGTLDLNAWFMTVDGRPGVFVQSIFDDSKVTAFGMNLGDEITRFCGEEVRSANQLATLVGVLPAATWVRLAFRPKNDLGKFGEEREVQFALRRLDTGSSNAEERIATREQRKIALEAMLRRVADEADADGCSLLIRGPEGREVLLRRRGDSLRIDDGSLALVRTDDTSGFAIDGDAVRELSAGERAKLDRIFAANPLLHRGSGLRAMCREGLLDGGTMVDRRPAFRVKLPGDGDLRILMFDDGTPAGCRYRDPVQKALIDLRRDGDHSRVFKNDELAAGWSLDAPRFEAQDPALFTRPSR